MTTSGDIIDSIGLLLLGSYTHECITCYGVNDVSNDDDNRAAKLRPALQRIDTIGTDAMNDDIDSNYAASAVVRTDINSSNVDDTSQQINGKYNDVIDTQAV